MSKKIVIFDLDGTLFMTESVTVPAALMAFSENNITNIDEIDIIANIGEKSKDFINNLLHDKEIEDHDKIMNEFNVYEKLMISEKGKLYSKVKDMLEELEELGYTLAICSNGSTEYIDLVLSTCKIKHFFKYIKGRSMTQSKSEVLRDIINECEPDFAIVVGDRYHDFESAKDNNIPSVGVSYGYGNENELVKANLISHNTEEIVSSIILAEIYEKISNRINNNNDRPYIIGVNGVDTSGKTRFSINLNKYLRSRGHTADLIHIDDFHNPRKKRREGKNEIEAYIHNAFNLELLASNVLKPLKHNGELNTELTLLDLDTDEFTNKKYFNIDNNAVIIVEGVLLYREPINEYFDYRVFLDITFDEVINRARVRDVPLYGEHFLKKYKNKYIPIQKWYLSNYIPKEKSDMVIDNNDYKRPRFELKG